MAIPALLAATGSTGLAFGLNKLFGKDDEPSALSGFELPDFFEDPEFKRQQKFLGDFGIDVLGGKVPEFFRGIGEAGSPEFENLLRQGTGDITRGITETAALTGRGRGGGVSSQVGKEVGRFSTEARFNDLLRAMEGKKFLFQQGRGISEGTRSAGFAEESSRNQFALNRSKLDFAHRSALDEQEATIGGLEGENFSQLLNTAIKGGVGFATGGPAGAAAAVFPDLLNVLNSGKRPKTQKGGVDLGNILQNFNSASGKSSSVFN